MTDEQDKPPRRPRSAGVPRRGAGPGTGKPFGKPRGDRTGKSGVDGPKRAAGKPAWKDRPRAAAASGDARPPRGGGFGKKPAARPSDRMRDDGEKPRRTEGEAGGGVTRRPWKDRPRSGGATEQPRPPRDGFGKKPAHKPSDRMRGEGEKPRFRPRAESSATGAEDAPRRSWKDHPRDVASRGRPDRGERKPFSDGKGQGDRPFSRPVRRDQSAGTEGPIVERARLAPRRPASGATPDRKPFRARPRDEAQTEPGERIAKRLARAGIASRRDAETLIAAGRVRVNGAVLASPAVNVMPEDAIEIDGQPLPPAERTRLFLFHKPAGVVTTSRDPEGRRTVFDILPDGLPRLMTVGRLDINTEGLMLLTNDGGLARILELPATGWLRRYRVRVHGTVDEKRLAGLKDGIAVDGVFYGAVEASLERVQGSNAWLTVGIREGKNREVKAIMGALGLEVNRLIRVSFGPFQLGELEEGHVLEIKGRTLREQLGERLIEEAGANFEGEIATPFPNRPVVRGREPDSAAPPAPKPARIREGGLIKARDQAREVQAKRAERPERRGKPRDRETILGRLTTSPDRPPRDGKPDARREPQKRFEKSGDKPRFAKGEGRPRKDEPLTRPRTTNIWMAPGARPASDGGKAAVSRDKPKPQRRTDGNDRGDRPDRGPPRPGKRGDADRRR